MQQTIIWLWTEKRKFGQVFGGIVQWVLLASDFLSVPENYFSMYILVLNHVRYIKLYD